MNTPTDEQIAKLPKWAQERITQLERQLETWKGNALRFASEQPESPFYVDEWLSEPRIKRYISTPTNRVCVEHAGVKLEIYLPQKGDSQRLYGIELTYSRPNDLHGDIALIPRDHCGVQLLAQENMR